MSVSIAIDLGGTIIKIGLLKNGEILDLITLPAKSAQGVAANLPGLDAAIWLLLQKSNLKKSDLLGIGFSFAGLVDSKRHTIISTNQKYDDGPQTDLKSWARQQWNCPIFLENDARMALLGEWQHGVGLGCDNLVMLTFGTGVGSAVVIEGQLLKGKHFQAGNLGGHFIINHQGHTCTCGNIGCVEAEASTWRLPTLLRESPDFTKSTISNEETLDFEALFKHAENGDKLSQEVLVHCYSVWSACIINMIHAYDPEKVILSGGIMQSADKILPPLRQKVQEQAWTPWGQVKLLVAEHLNYAALYGADYLVRSQLLKKP